MNGAAALLDQLAPAARERVLKEYVQELLTGRKVDNPHPGTADILSLPAHDRTLGAIIDGMERGGMTNPSLPSYSRDLLSSVLDPSLLALAKQYPAPQHRAFCQVMTVPNYKEQSFIGGFDALTVEPVGELAEIPTTLSDSISYELERGSVTQHGRVLRIPRRDVVNDGSGIFFRNAANALLAASFRREATSVYSLLENGTTLRDGQPWFDASNSTTQPSVLGALEKGFELFAAQKYASGEFTDNVPSVLVIPAEWTITVSNIVSDILLNIGKLTVIKTGRVTAGYLFANPAAHPALLLAGLNQNVQPSVEVNMKPKLSLDVGLELRVLHSFAPVAVSRLGIVRMSVS